MERVQEFESAARAVGAEVVHLDRESLEAGVSSYLQELRVERISVDSDRVRLDDFERAEPATADCGVTDVAWGIASTGTLAIPMNAGNRRSTSLLPLSTSLFSIRRHCWRTWAAPSDTCTRIS